MIKKLGSILTITSILSTGASAIDTENISLGFQSSYLAYGISAKYDFTEKTHAQGIVGFLGTVNTYTVRGIYDYYQKPNLDIYAFGSVGIWTWDNYLYDESVVGFGAGSGLEYDIRGLDSELPPLLLSAELGLNVVNFEHYGSFSSLGLGLGIHYKF